MKVGDVGKDVKALQIRIAGWFPRDDRTEFMIDGVYGRQTKRAVRAFKRGYGLDGGGRATRKVLKILRGLQDPDGSTKHFDWSEFSQNSSAACSADANGYAGTFVGGPVSPRVIKRNVRRLMWRLEAVRKKAGEKVIGINSAFRSLTYNDCIGGASASQHLYGAAVDLRIAETDNATGREIAKGSQMGGIGCYSTLSHNHFDIRLENDSLPNSQSWWWPLQDKRGRDLDYEGKRCWGQGKTKVDPSDPSSSRVVIGGMVLTSSSAGSEEPSEAEIEAFEQRGESDDYAGED